MRILSVVTLAIFTVFTPFAALQAADDVSAAGPPANALPSERGVAFYEQQVLPVLRQHCLKCHSHAAGKARGGLVLDARQSILAGGDSGPAAIPSDPQQSLLIEAVRYDSDAIQMPPSGKIAEDQIKILVEWVRRGVPAPLSNPTTAAPATAIEAESHWAFQSLQSPAIAGNANVPPRMVIDSLIAEARSEAGLVPVGFASSTTRTRRLYFDLIGLPPSPEEASVMADASDAEFESLVDRLLARPEFGERWGRHWLDVARYADSNGCSIESNNTYDNAWRYRDYVISAWNADKPYDQFVVEQIAGDLLEAESNEARCEQLIATGFLLLGPKAFGTSGEEQFRLDVIDEQIDTIGKAMLGLSIGCARCHDHKFDPVPTADYYALAGIFSSTESVHREKGWRQGRTWHRVKLPLLDAKAEQALLDAHEKTKQEAKNGELVRRAKERLEAAQAAMKELRDASPADATMRAAEQALRDAEREMKNARNMAKVIPVISPLPVAMAVQDKPEPQNEAIRIRGEADNHGELVERRVLSLFNGGAAPIPGDQSGRLALANWLVDPADGAGELLARVAVNRVWGHLFARPLVTSADNFGLTGAKPSHPLLLDYLAATLIESDWSMKALIREIVLTDAYRLAATAQPAGMRQDPDNILLWRYEPKRLDVEVLRDSLLAITGQLDTARGGKTLQHLGLVSLGGDHLVLDAPSPYQRRSVYLPIYRDAIGLTSDIDASMGMLATFDFADPNLMAGLRPKTVVPAQALFLMNGEFIYQQAAELARHLLQYSKDDEERLGRLMQLVHNRSVGDLEAERLLQFLGESRRSDIYSAEDTEASAEHAVWTSLCQAVFGSNEFLFQN